RAAEVHVDLEVADVPALALRVEGDGYRGAGCERGREQAGRGRARVVAAGRHRLVAEDLVPVDLDHVGEALAPSGGCAHQSLSVALPRRPSKSAGSETSVYRAIA